MKIKVDEKVKLNSDSQKQRKCSQQLHNSNIANRCMFEMQNQKNKQPLPLQPIYRQLSKDNLNNKL